MKVNRCLSSFGKAALPGRYLVDSYPFLRWVPGYLKELYEYHKDELALFRSQLELVRSKMVCALI